MATIKRYKSSFYMMNYYNNLRPQLHSTRSNMSFLFICKCMFFYCKSRHAETYSRNLGQRLILARKGTYEKVHFFEKRPPKIYI